MNVHADDALTMLCARPVARRRAWLGTLPVKLLREMADLCGVDAECLTKGEAISAILDNF